MPVIQPIDTFGSLENVEKAQTISAEAVVTAIQRFDGVPQTDPAVIECAWRHIKAALWSGKLQAQRCYDRMCDWEPVLVVRASRMGLWMFRDESQLPRIRVVRRKPNSSGPWLYPLDEDTRCLLLLRCQESIRAKLNLSRLETEYQDAVAAILGLPLDVAEQEAKDRRLSTMQQARITLNLERIERELRQSGVETGTSQEPHENKTSPFASDREAWLEARRMAGLLFRYRASHVVIPADASADEAIRRFCDKLRLSGDGVILARLRRERRLSDEQIVFVALLVLRHYGLPVAVSDLYLLPCGIDPIALTALRLAVRRKRSLSELVERDGEDLIPSTVLIENVNGRIDAKDWLRVLEDLTNAGIGTAERPDVPDNKKPMKDEGKGTSESDGHPTEK